MIVFTYQVIINKIDMEGNQEEGSITADVVNEAGVELPETGGMGTTIFYVLGAILVLGSVVALIVKKSMI